ncbi:UNVERIFIED_CONTAM: Phytolongin Phyl1.1 [Sesamum latifolium]|uniref:Phytolongin Phyl1.1 n=1 Tax=Sesamum latifolium TaxID=2727402 RepID=A0AAW2WAW2_9LAMI
MDPVKTTVYYCCVSMGNRVLCSYNSGDHGIEDLAALCLERTPPFHRWYFQTTGKTTFGFLMDEGYVYFAIVNRSLGNSQVLGFLEELRDQFRMVGKRGSTTSVSSLNTSLCLQEQLLPSVTRLVASLERLSLSASGTVTTDWPAQNASPLPYQGELALSPCNNANGHIETGSSTKAPLLGKHSKQEKRKMKDHVIAVTVRDTEMEEHRRSTDRGVKIDSGLLNSSSQGTSSASPMRKEFGSTRIKSGSQNLQRKWCRQVRIVLAIDAAVCLVLFIIWLIICHGTECIR